MFEIEKFKFINPSQIARIEVEESAIITKEKDAGTMTVSVFMADQGSYSFSKPKKDCVAIVNHLMSMVNTANNPFLSLPAQQPQKAEPPADRPTRIPSDGKGVGQHKVDPNVFPPEMRDEAGFPIKGTKDWPVGHPQHPDTIAKAEADAAIEAEVQKRLAEQQAATARQAKVPTPPEEKTGEMDVPDHMKEIPLPPKIVPIRTPEIPIPASPVPDYDPVPDVDPSPFG